MLSKLLKDMLTEKDGEIYCPVRVLGCFSFFSLHLFALIYVIKDCNLNFLEVSGGITMLLSAIAAGTTFKYTKEN